MNFLFHKTLSRTTVLAVFFLFSFSAHSFGAAVTFSSISVSNSTPLAGSVVGVTIVYCDGTFDQPCFHVALNPNFTTVQSCPAANQVFLVDTNTTPTQTSPVSSSVADTTDSGKGWEGVNTAGTAACPATQVFNVTIPASEPGGTYNLIVEEQGYYVSCAQAGNATTYTTITIPLPPAAISITKSVGATIAAPDSLILFNLNYTYVNTTNVVLSDNVPANTTLVQVGPGGSSTGTTPGSVMTWNIGPAVAGAAATGTAWFLAQVNSSAVSGSLITNTASGLSDQVSTTPSNPVTVVVQPPQMVLTKSESATSAAANSTVTYTLSWDALGSSLQIYDSYKNDTVGVSNGSIAGYDGTLYTQYAASTGDLGTWQVDTDASGNHFIEGKVSTFNSGGGGGDYPALIRNGPGINICDGFTVQGDLQIPVTAQGVTVGGGADDHMILAVNGSQGITLKAAISLDSSPAYLFIQKNNIYNGTLYPTPAGTNTLPFTVTPGVWYTVNVNVQFSGSGGVTYTAKVWPANNPSLVGTLTYIDSTAPIPTCSGGWLQGWQVDETAGTGYFSNLQVYSGGPIINYQVNDAVPSDITYVGSNVSPATGAPALSWSFPGTVLSQTTALNWWGLVACPGPISNQFSMSSLTAPTTVSNTVNLTVTGSCNTPTPTDTPTVGPTSTFTATPTITATQTPTLTMTPSPTATMTSSPTFTFTPTQTLTPTVTATPPPPTATNTPVTPIEIWPIPFNPKYAVNGKLKVSGLPPGATVSFYTVSGELVYKSAEVAGWAYWDGTNPQGRLVSSGIYYYIVLNGKQVLLRGKLLFINE